MTNKETIKMLKPLENNLLNAVEADFCRQFTKPQINTMRQWWKDKFGSDYELNEACGNCVLSFAQKVGRCYLRAVEEEAEDALNEIKITPAPSNDKKVSIKKAKKNK